MGNCIAAGSRYYNSNRQYLNERELCSRWQDQQLFGDWPFEVYNRQFISFNTYSNGKDLYIIYNDYNNSRTTPTRAIRCIPSARPMRYITR